jgi:ubiquinone/menaquinone biosynthesis C-methylase UbiE
MEKQMSKGHFKMMTFTFKIRDLFSPRRKVLEEVGIQSGFNVLDYGCGPGSYVIPAAKLVGQSGKIYALDIHPLAIEKVKSLASKKSWTNVKTIQSDCKTDLDDNSIDVVLLYDTFHDVDDPEGVLQELHRVLKSDGLLSFSDHHLKEDEIVSEVMKGSLFKLSKKGKKTYSFLKER